MSLVKTKYPFRLALRLRLNNDIVLVPRFPSPGMSVDEFILRCEWNEREDELYLKRNRVRCLKEELGSKYLSPHSLALREVPVYIFHVLKNYPKDKFLYLEPNTV